MIFFPPPFLPGISFRIFPLFKTKIKFLSFSWIKLTFFHHLMCKKWGGGEGVTWRRKQIPFQSALQPFSILVCFSWWPNATGTNHKLSGVLLPVCLSKQQFSVPPMRGSWGFYIWRGMHGKTWPCSPRCVFHNLPLPLFSAKHRYCLTH